MEETTKADGKHEVVTRAFDDERMEIIMGRLLQGGVLLAAAVVLIGGVMYAAAHAGADTHYHTFRPNPLDLRHPSAMLRRVLEGEAAAIVQLGLIVLIATPVCRVGFAVVAFLLERDWLYIAVSLTVLAVLLFGMFRGG